MKKYSFYDTFVKTCEFNNGQGDCTKTRESKKCINDNCEIVKIPMKKKEILNDYYQNYTSQIGSGYEQRDTFKCPYCDQILLIKDLPRHIKSHTSLDSSKLNTFSNIKPTTNELFPQFGGCDTCMIGGSKSKNKYTCPICHEHHFISDMKTHYFKSHK